MFERQIPAVLQSFNAAVPGVSPSVMFIAPGAGELCRVQWRTRYPAAPVTSPSAFEAWPSHNAFPLPQADTANDKRPRAVLRFCGWEFDLLERRLVAPGGGVEILPGLEFALLRMLVEQPGRVLRRADLARALTRTGKARLAGRTVDSYVSRLRRRLARGGADALIGTISRVGYRFEA